ncbi:myelin protein zero-like protein 2b [Betta splendens]|uniref:Myelin protein zero-like protein 2b n=1 Tax=Betta splendens TaxID=158456 RepID=A0A6P7PDS0_BETSP|nr:myelin protein zero-like protein 2b [Betta splendens]
MIRPVIRTWLLLLAGLLPAVQHVIGIDIFTTGELEAVNGTDVKLKCTFTSTHPVTLQSVIATWSFRGLNSKIDESVFYYQEEPLPPTDGRFKGRVLWSGNVLKRDVSITLQDVQPTFNGTYICQVRNRPDVHGSSGETVLRVVDKVTLSEIGILAAAVGGACGVVLIILAMVVGVRLCRRNRMDHNIEMHPKEQGPGVW